MEKNEDNPRVTREALERRRDKMNEAVPDCLVEDFESLIEAVELRDPNDRHVVAPAIKAKAQTIVANDKDFGDGALEVWDIDHQTADLFVLGLIEINRGLVLEGPERAVPGPGDARV